MFACILLSLLSLSTAYSGKCAFSGSCLYNKDIGKSVPCVVDSSPANSFNDSLWSEFEDFCDDLAPTVTNRELCCDAQQFITLKKEMKAAEAIGMKKCPGCHRAFKNLMCQMTCSPRQAEFVIVNATLPTPHSGLAVKEIVYGLDKGFGNTLYETCNTARSNLYVKLTTLMCGAYGNRCNTNRFLNYIGAIDSEGGFSPFKIRHILLDDDLTTITDFRGLNHNLVRQRWTAASKCK